MILLIKEFCVLEEYSEIDTAEEIKTRNMEGIETHGITNLTQETEVEIGVDTIIHVKYQKELPEEMEQFTIIIII